MAGGGLTTEHVCVCVCVCGGGRRGGFACSVVAVLIGTQTTVALRHSLYEHIAIFETKINEFIYGCVNMARLITRQAPPPLPEHHGSHLGAPGVQLFSFSTDGTHAM